MCIPISELQVGQTAEIRVRELPYLVLEQKPEGTLFLKPDFSTELLESGYAIKTTRQVEAVLNTKSNIVHMTLNGRSICGSRHGQDTITVGIGMVNCERCKEILNQTGLD